MNSRVEDARLLCNDKENIKNFQKGINILETLAFNSLNSSTSRINALETLAQFDKAAASDVLCRIQDTIPFIIDSKQDPEAEVDILSHVATCKYFSSHERLTSVVCLHNNNYIMEPLNLFLKLASDNTVNPSYRVEACMYLIYSEGENFREKTIDVLKELISDHELSDKFRYEDIICKFNKKLGLETILNKDSLNVKYDEELLYELQIVYFNDRKNKIRNRLWSGQHLLQMSCTPNEIKDQIGEELLNIANNYSDEESSVMEIYNIKADAVDILIRVGLKKHADIARNILEELGDFSNDDDPSILKLKGTKTYITDAQNIHNVSIIK